MFKIIEVKKNSIADELGIKAGDKLVSFNDKPVVDVLDCAFFDAENLFTMQILSKEEIIDFEIEKDEYDDLGIVLSDDAEIKPIRCANKCIFCFVDQLPKNMRKTLYFKDDDYRLSFISGNYITLTNMSDSEFIRIKERLFSPIYISVHATDACTRRHMLHNKRAGEILQRIFELDSANIEMHCQIVLCPNINDGDILIKTLTDLYGFKNIKSVAVVPVGLTRFSKSNLTPVDKNKATEVINTIEAFNKTHKNVASSNKYFVYASDEFYVKAERDVLPYDDYGNFCQVENGVGLVAKFDYECLEAINNADKKLIRAKKISIATGLSAYLCIKRMTKHINMLYNDIEIQVYAIHNNFFGDTVTVSGLLTGQDIISQLKDRDLGEKLFITKTMLKEFGTVFLDDYSLDDLRKELAVEIAAISPDGGSFIKAMLY